MSGLSADGVCGDLFFLLLLFYEAVTFTEERNNKSLIRQPGFGRSREGVIVWDSDIDSLRGRGDWVFNKKHPLSKQHLGTLDGCLDQVCG